MRRQPQGRAPGGERVQLGHVRDGERIWPGKSKPRSFHHPLVAARRLLGLREQPRVPEGRKLRRVDRRDGDSDRAIWRERHGERLRVRQGGVHEARLREHVFKRHHRIDRQRQGNVQAPGRPRPRGHHNHDRLHDVLRVGAHHVSRPRLRLVLVRYLKETVLAAASQELAR